MMLINRIKSFVCGEPAGTSEPHLGSRDWKPLSVLRSSGQFLRESVSWSQGFFEGKRVISFKSRIQFIKWLISNNLYRKIKVFLEVFLGDKWLRKVGFSGVEASLIKKYEKQIESLDPSTLEDILKDPEKFKELFSEDTAAWALAFGNRELMDLVIPRIEMEEPALGNGGENIEFNMGNVGYRLPLILQNISTSVVTGYSTLHGTPFLPEENRQEYAQILLDDGADIDARDDCGRTPLFYALFKELAKGPDEKGLDLSFIDFLLEKGADINACDKDGNTLLIHILSKNIKNECLKRTILTQFLIDRGADLFANNKENYSPWIFAVHNFPAQLHGFLLSFINKTKKSYRENPFHVAKEEEPEFYRNVTLHALTLGGGMACAYNEQIFPLLSLMLQEFSEKNPDQGSLENVIRSLREIPLQPRYLQDPTKISFFNTGWKNHAVSLVFYQGYLFICNRGNRGYLNKPILVYKINSDKIDATIMDKIYSNKGLDVEAGSDFIYRVLPESLEGEKDAFCERLEQAASHQTQKIGNCGWVQPKLAVIVALLADKYFKDDEETRARFNFEREFLDLGKTFSIFTRFWLLKRIKSFTPSKHQALQALPVEATENKSGVLSMRNFLAAIIRKTESLADFILRTGSKKQQKSILNSFFRTLQKSVVIMPKVRLPISDILQRLCQGLGSKAELIQAYERRGCHFEAAVLETYLS